MEIAGFFSIDPLLRSVEAVKRRIPLVFCLSQNGDAQFIAELLCGDDSSVAICSERPTVREARVWRYIEKVGIALGWAGDPHGAEFIARTDPTGALSVDGNRTRDTKIALSTRIADVFPLLEGPAYKGDG